MSFGLKKHSWFFSIMQSQRRTVLKVRQRGEVEHTEGGKIQRMRRRRRSGRGDMKGTLQKECAVVRRRRRRGGEEKGCGGDRMK